MRTARLLLFIGLGFLGASSFAASKSAAKKMEAPAAKISKAAAERLSKAAVPGPQHKLLDPLVGSWEESTRRWNTPKDTPEPTPGSCETQWILGGRFLEQKFSGVEHGQKVEGLRLTGYDTLADRFFSNEYGTTSTSVLTAYGAYDSRTQTLNAAGTVGDPLSGQPKSVRTVLRFIDADTHVYEMYVSQPNGLELRALEIVSKRKKV